jgi:hypothetical protein
MEPKFFVGYWNQNEVDPEITFDVPREGGDTRKLVLITIEDIGGNRKELNPINTKCKKLSRGLDKLIKASNRLKTKFR